MAGKLLRGERVRLAAHEKDDNPIIRRWYDDPEFPHLLEYFPARPQRLEAVETALERMDKSEHDFLFGIRLMEADQLIGLISLEQIDWPNGTAWMGVGIGEPQYRGKGYGTEATQLLLKYAFHEINLHRVQLTVFAYNPAAIAVYEKLGFVKEGVMRERLHRDGQRHDVLMYGLLRHEWEKTSYN